MTDAVKPPPDADEVSFRFVSGHRALDLTATLGDRYRVGVERLRQPGDLDRWLRSAGVQTCMPAVAHDLRDARLLRDVIYRLARAVLHDEPPDSHDVTALNGWARQPTLVPQLDSDLRRDETSLQPVTSALAMLAREAIELLTGSSRELIRECAAAPQCSLLYLDRSRGQRRRWCQMDKCGSRAKMVEYRKRRVRDEALGPIGG